MDSRKFLYFREKTVQPQSYSNLNDCNFQEIDGLMEFQNLRKQPGPEGIQSVLVYLKQRYKTERIPLMNAKEAISTSMAHDRHSNYYV